MEMLAVLLAGSVTLAVLASPVAVAVLLARSAEQARRLAALDEELDALHARYRSLAERVADLACFAPVADGTDAGPKATPYRRAAARPTREASARPAPIPPPQAPSTGSSPPIAPRASEPPANGDATTEPAPRPVAAPGPVLPTAAPVPDVGAPASTDWEHWLGVRGAAALGACALVVASLYFFKYSIDRGILSPPVRVGLGVAVGLACLAASERVLARAHAILANWLAGAGVAVLYTAIWAARALYHLTGAELAFALMALVTAACAALSVRRSSLAVAVLGLAGGFATPFALSNGEDHPIALFGYVLLLDVALIGIARLRRWPVLGALSLAGTLAYEAAWIGLRMDAPRLGLGLGLVLLFAGLFALGVRPEGEHDGVSRATRAGALGLGVAFGVHLAMRADLAAGLPWVAATLGLLGAAAAWIARRGGARWLAPATAAASVAAVAASLVERQAAAPAGANAWTAPLLVGGLALVHHAYLEAERRWPSAAGSDASLSAAVASLGGIAALVALGVAAPAGSTPWPLLAGAGALALLTTRQASFEGRAPLHVAAAAALALALDALRLAHGGERGFPSPAAWLGAGGAIGLSLALVALARRTPEGRRAAWHGAALFACALVLDPILGPLPYPGPWLFGATAAFVALALAASTALGAGAWAVVAMLGAAAVHSTWALAGTDTHAFATNALALEALFVGALSAWPLVARRVRADRAAALVAILAGPAWFFALDRSHRVAFGSATDGVVPAGLALAAGAAALLALRRRPRREEGDADPLAPLVGAAIAFVTIAIPMQFANETVTILWALEGLALVAFFRRARHGGLLAAAALHLGAVTVRLVANPAVLSYHPRPELRLWNWLAPTYGPPALALVAAAWLLASAPERAADRALDDARRALARGAELAAVAVVFTWLNLAIVAAYASGPTIDFTLRHVPARDLALSMAWAVYALVLLGVGMARASAILRWTSLVLVLVTVGKVFLYDLAELEDLYRVASLMGLALSLIAISLAYQRFVFGAGRAEERA
jgi:uncharacterized membrane protein